MLKAFFKPKWQHDKPEVRKEAIAALPASEVAILREIACSDPEANLRCEAVRRINDMDTLVDLIATANNWEVRQLAQQCFQQLFAGIKENPPPLAQRLARIDGITDLVLLEFLAKNAKEAELRQAVLNKVSQDALCGDIAIFDPVAHIRLCAVEKVTGKPTLERVVEATRNRDKGVYRIAKERLDAIIEIEEKPKRLRAQRENLCKRVETLFKAARWDISESELSALEQQWGEIEGAPEADLALQFSARLNDIRAARAAHQAHQALLKRCRDGKNEVFQLVENFAARHRSAEFLSPKQAAAALAELDEHEAAWRLAEAIPDSAEEQDWQKRFRNVSTETRQFIQTAERNGALQHKLQKICADMEKLLHSQTPLAKQRAKEFEQRWLDAFPAKPEGQFVHALRDRYQNALQALQGRYQEQRAHQDEVLAELNAKLSELEADLEAGALQKAAPLEQSCRALLRQLPELPRAQQHHLEKRLHAAEAQFHELQSWQRWGNKREREELCEAMEALIGSQESPEILATQIKELQAEWQKLTEMDHSHSLWQRFHKAGQSAYAPCKVFFEERARARQDNLAQRQALCDTLAEFLSALENDAEPDWKKQHHHFQDLRQQWFAIGSTNRKARKEVDARFEELSQRLDAYFAPERARNISQRQALIAQAEALSAEQDLDKAIKEAKHLQKSWVITVPSNRKDERELWKAFRRACDQVFARRDQARAAEDEEYQAKQDAKAALCAELEAFLAQGEMAGAVQHLAQAQEKWQALGSLPRKYAKNLDQRFAQACQALQEAQRAWRVGKKRAQLDGLRHKAELCAQLESAAPENATALLSEIESAWQQLTPLEKNLESAIQARFARACEAVRAGRTPMTLSAEQQQHLELLCIRLEILKGLESPPASAQTRMAYQVERLARAMSGDKPAEEDGGAQELKAIEIAWYVSGPYQQEYAQRFTQALASAR
jgi:DNA repair protein SbcC/Rad50